jgi:putative flippase GtrA
MSNEQFRQESGPLDLRDDYPSVRRFTYRDMKKDKEHLRLLAIFHYICAAIYGVLGLIPGVYVFIGVLMVAGTMGRPPNGPPPEMGFFFIGIGSLIILIAETIAVCVLVAGRSLAQHKRYTFCFVTAILLCITILGGVLGVPGIVLGIFTIVVLARESVKELFARGDLAFGPDEDYD